MKKVRVLHIISSLNTGGAELFLLNLLKNFSNKNIEHDVICLSGKGTLSKKFQLVTNKVIHLNFKKNLFQTIKDFFYFYRFANKNKYGVIQGWMYHGNLFALIFCFLSKKSNLFWNIRQTLYSLKNEKFLTKLIIFLNSLFSKFPKMIICNSELSIKQHQNFGFKKKFIFIPNGIDLHKFNKNYQRKRKSDINIAHVARFHPMKNHSLALKVAHQIIAKNDNVNFFFIGKNVNYKNNFFKSKVSRQLLNKKIFLLNEKKNIDVFLRNIDILISTSSWGEGFPNILLEATAMGITCISTDIGDTKKILVNGFLINNKNKYKKFIDILEGIIKKDIRIKNKQNAYLSNYIRKNFSLKNICYKYEKIYCEYLNR